AHVFFFGLFNLFSERKIKGFVFCTCSIFVHFSFVLPLAILIVHLIVGNRLSITFLFYFSSFFVAQVTPDLLKNYTGFLPVVFQERSDKYTSEAYLEARRKLEQKKLN